MKNFLRKESLYHPFPHLFHMVKWKPLIIIDASIKFPRVARYFYLFNAEHSHHKKDSLGCKHFFLLWNLDANIFFFVESLMKTFFFLHVGSTNIFFCKILHALLQKSYGSPLIIQFNIFPCQRSWPDTESTLPTRNWRKNLRFWNFSWPANNCFRMGMEPACIHTLTSKLLKKCFPP